MISLYDHQKKAVKEMHDGCILCGGVGSGKSRTGLAYYYKEMGGDLFSEEYVKMIAPLDLYIITTAKKRNSKEWEQELIPFGMHVDSMKEELGNPFGYKNHIVIDSWNNIGKYDKAERSFFIFDEQRVVGKGAWVKSFLKIAKKNRWILLSATPGDTWSDYIPVFLANGFFRNKTEFYNEHCVFSRFTDYPKIDRYINVERLIRLRKRILVEMPMERKTVFHNEVVQCAYDKAAYKVLGKDRWNIFDSKPIETASELCYLWRRLVNSDKDRLAQFRRLVASHDKVIVFYNFDYELELIKKELDSMKKYYQEWNGHKHQDLPDCEKWAYLVQYTAGCEGWNCITTDTIIFYSLNYSYKVMEQASGRINRLNTPFVDLYSYQLRSYAPIDLAISRALREKKKFNEGRFVQRLN